MPRTYVRKNVDTYSDASLQLAILAVENGKSIYAASKEFKIPYQTLRRWVNNKPRRKGPGRESWMTLEEESCIVDSLKFIAQCGYPFDRSDIANLIYTYFKFQTSRKSPFGKNPPGSDYLRNFEKRWANELTKRKPELLTKARAAHLTIETVTSFFDRYAKIIQENGLQDSPERIFNVDEAGLGTDSRNSPVFVQKSSRNAYMKSATQGKTMFSVLFGISASGHYMPPFTIYKGAHLYESWTRGGPPKALYACTESGWMQDSVFESWMDHFITYTESLQKPVLLIYDGHGSHMTYGTVRKAVDNNIIILCLPPHTSHALQPLDVGVFSPLKKVWKGILKKWFRESRLQIVSKSIFPFLLKQLCECLRPQNAIKGFLGSGLYPINMKEVEKRIVLTEISRPTSSTDQHNLNPEPSTSRTDERNISNNIIASPLKDLKRAILETLSPSISDENKMAMQNSKRKRKRVQAKTGEVLTETTVVFRLRKEQEERTKKLHQVHSPKKRKIISNQQPPFMNKFMAPKDIGMSENISVGCWVLVKYEGKKSMKQFVGQIIGRNEDLFSIKYLKKSKIGNYYTFPESDDTDEIEKSDVIKILEEPDFNNRGHYKFTL